MDLKEKVRVLEQLRRLRGEVDMLSQSIAQLAPDARRRGEPVAGLPRGARPDGAWAAALAARLDARRQRCMELLGQLYAFIDDVDDSLMRQILTCRYIDGDTWRQVAARIGETDEQYPRRLHNRFLERECDGAALFDENDGE